LGTILGMGIYLNWTLLLIPAWVFWEVAQQAGLVAAAWQAGVVFAIFGCVLLHEFGHALMARRFGIATRDITLYPIGGVARLERMSRDPWEEFWIALAGPAVNVVIACLLLPVVAVTFLAFGLHRALEPVGVVGFLVQLWLANVVLVLFNLLPAFPMDGGRVLRALLASGMSYLRATQWAANLGAVMAIVFVAAGLFVRGMPPLLAVIGPFIMLLGQQELAVVRQREAARTARPLDVLPVHEAPVATAAATRGFSGFIWDSHAGLWIQWRNGRPIQPVFGDSD
jgi:Zn-dependent protease